MPLYLLKLQWRDNHKSRFAVPAVLTAMRVHTGCPSVHWRIGRIRCKCRVSHRSLRDLTFHARHRPPPDDTRLTNDHRMIVPGIGPRAPHLRVIGTEFRTQRALDSLAWCLLPGRISLLRAYAVASRGPGGDRAAGDAIWSSVWVAAVPASKALPKPPTRLPFSYRIVPNRLPDWSYPVQTP